MNLASNNATFKVSDAYGFVEWNRTKAHLDVIVNMKMKDRPDILSRFKGEDGLAEFGLVGGVEPGALIVWPFSRWLCNVPSNMNNHEMNEALDKKKATYKDLMRFIPLKDIPPNSF